MDLKEIWAAALGELQIGLTKANFDTWFKETAVVSEEDDVFCVGVPNAFAREWLENKYRGQVRQALQHIVGRTVDVRFITAPATAASTRASAGIRPSIPAAAAAARSIVRIAKIARVSSLIVGLLFGKARKCESQTQSVPDCRHCM